MRHYVYRGATVRSYLKRIYDGGLKPSAYLGEREIEEILWRIGIFKFKGYFFAFKPSYCDHSIDDVLALYYFDKYMSRILMDITSSIETRLKSELVEACYKQINSLPNGHPQKNNPFFYLIADNYRRSDPELKGPTLNNWKIASKAPLQESYVHYGLYYRGRYDFDDNFRHYLAGQKPIKLHDGINYPPFHYLIESSVLGTVLYLIKYLTVDGYDIAGAVAKRFGIANPEKVSFVHYIERLNEIRNRAAHRERIFNRNYRSVKRVGHYHRLSRNLDNHKLMDVYLFLFFMLGRIESFEDFEAFQKREVDTLFHCFRKDRFINQESKDLIAKLSEDDFEKIREFILKGMS